MKTKYAVLNPMNGTYVFAETYEGACVELARVGYEFYKFHCHGSPCVYVEIKEDGSEVWRNDQGIKMPSPEDIRKEQLKVVAISTRTHDDIPKVIL